MREYETETFVTSHTQHCSTTTKHRALTTNLRLCACVAALMTNRQQKHHRELNPPKIMHSYYFMERDLFTYKTQWCIQF